MRMLVLRAGVLSLLAALVLGACTDEDAGAPSTPAVLDVTRVPAQPERPSPFVSYLDALVAGGVLHSVSVDYARGGTHSSVSDARGAEIALPEATVTHSWLRVDTNGRGTERISATFDTGQQLLIRSEFTGRVFREEYVPAGAVRRVDFGDDAPSDLFASMRDGAGVMPAVLRERLAAGELRVEPSQREDAIVLVDEGATRCGLPLREPPEGPVVVRIEVSEGDFGALLRSWCEEQDGGALLASAAITHEVLPLSSWPYVLEAVRD